MEVIPTALPDVVIIRPRVFVDTRGCFFESYNGQRFDKLVRPIRFVQDNQSQSVKGTLRGLHYQLAPHAQSKLVRVVQGRVIDVAVDIRRDSPSFGRSVAVELSDENHQQLFVPRGFAHGFVVLSETAIFEYKVDNFYSPESERGIRYDDPDLKIDWGIALDQVVLSAKDEKLPRFKDADVFETGHGLYDR